MPAQTEQKVSSSTEHLRKDLDWHCYHLHRLGVTQKKRKKKQKTAKPTTNKKKKNPKNKKPQVFRIVPIPAIYCTSKYFYTEPGK